MICKFKFGHLTAAKQRILDYGFEEIKRQFYFLTPCTDSSQEPAFLSHMSQSQLVTS